MHISKEQRLAPVSVSDEANLNVCDTAFTRRQIEVFETFGALASFAGQALCEPAP